MSLSLQDLLLFALVIGSMSTLIAGDISAYLLSNRKLPAPGVDKRAKSSHPVKTLVERHMQSGRDAVTHNPTPPHALPSALPQVADLLVVDDSAVARAKLRKLLVGSGYEVHLANDGVEALARLREGRYSLMITDLEMPNMDGIALIHECLRRPQTASMPILAVSAHENLRAKFNECRQICGVHRKPWSDDILLSHIFTLIGAGGHTSKTGAHRVRVAA